MTDLRISTPCAADWNSMRPNAGGRHCSLCAKTVVDLTCLAPAERDIEFARIATIIQAGTRVCIRTPATRDGRVLSASRRILSGGMAAMLAMTVAGCQGSGSEQTIQHPAVETHEVPTMTGEAECPSHLMGKPQMGDVMMGAMVAPPPKQVDPVAPHAAQ